MVGKHELGCGKAGLVVDDKLFGQAPEPGPIVGFHCGTVCAELEAWVVLNPGNNKDGKRNENRRGSFDEVTDPSSWDFGL